MFTLIDWYKRKSKKRNRMKAEYDFEREWHAEREEKRVELAKLDERIKAKYQEMGLVNERDEAIYKTVQEKDQHIAFLQSTVDKLVAELGKAQSSSTVEVINNK